MNTMKNASKAALLFMFLIMASSTMFGQLSGSNTLGTDPLCYDDIEVSACYDVTIICPLTIEPLTPAEIDLGYLNPDGAKMIHDKSMKWLVNGGWGWYFEAHCSNDIFSNESPHVYFVGSKWYYQASESSSYELLNAVPTSGEYDQTVHATSLRLSSDGLYPGSCNGYGRFVFNPNMVVADELALQGKYTWDVFLSVDYLTWDTPINMDGSPIANTNNNDN